MNEQNIQNSKNTRSIIKHQTETKRLKKGSQRRRGHSLPHFPHLNYSQSKGKHRVSLINSKQEKDIQSQPSRSSSIIDDLTSYISNSKVFTSKGKTQILEKLKLLSKTCKINSKKNSRSFADSNVFKNQWNETKNLMYSDLEGKIQKNRSKCLSFFEQLTDTLEKRVQNSRINNSHDDNNEEEEKDENVTLLEQVNHIQKDLETVSDQINGFKKIQEDLSLQSQPDTKLIDLFTMTIQSLINFRDSFTQKYSVFDKIEKYESEMKEFYPLLESNNTSKVGNNDENNNEIENESNGENDNSSTKSVPAYSKPNQNNNTSQKQQRQPRKPSLMTQKENEEYKSLIAQKHEINFSLKRSRRNKKDLEKKKKEIEELYQDEIEKNQKTIKSLQKKKQVADSALQELQMLTNDIQNMRGSLKQLQSKVIPLRQSVNQLDNEGTKKVHEHLEYLLNENTSMESEIRNMKTNILTNEEIVYVKQSIEKEKKDQQNQVYSIPSLIYNKQHDVAIMRSSNRFASSLPVYIDDPENIYIQYDRLKNLRQEQIDSLSREKMKMKKQILSNEAKLRKNTDDIHNILLQIRQYANVDKENKENKALSIFQKTQTDINILRTKAKTTINEISNTDNENEKILQEIQKEAKQEAKEEATVMKKEIKNTKPLLKEILKQTNECREKAKEPKVDALMNSCLEYLIQKKISINDEKDYNLESEIHQLVSQTEAYNGKLSSMINKATDHLNELANRMLGTNHLGAKQDPIKILKELGGILRQNEIQKLKDIRQIGD